MRVGTIEHRDLFCRTFIAGYWEYEAGDSPWPELSSTHLGCLRVVPFWGVAHAGEQTAGMMVRALADTLRDPVFRAAAVGVAA